MSEKNVRVEFAPGALDDFDGTQEELNEFIAEIKNMVLHGDLYEKSEPVDMDALALEDPELHKIISDRMNNINANTRRLN